MNSVRCLNVSSGLASRGRQTSDSLVGEAAPLCVPGVLVDDLRGDGLLLLLLLPHQQDALVDEDVLLLHTGGTQAVRRPGRDTSATVPSR